MICEVFFRFLKETNPALSDKPLSEISLFGPFYVKAC